MQWAGAKEMLAFGGGEAMVVAAFEKGERRHENIDKVDDDKMNQSTERMSFAKREKKEEAGWEVEQVGGTEGRKEEGREEGSEAPPCPRRQCACWPPPR